MDPDERRRLMDAGRDAFNRGDFYDAHEHWEEVWQEIDDPERRWVQGLIQVATGLHKLSRDQPASARTLLAKALDKLADAPAILDGMNVHSARETARAVDAAIARGAPVDLRAIRIPRA